LIRLRVRTLTAAVALSVATAVCVCAQPRPPLELLDVPYVLQSEELCGGAAAAMVMRFWGATGVYAETFSSLVDRAAGGIRGEDLMAALRTRGWQAIAFAGDAAALQAQLRQRRPPIALIEDRPGRFHYVVVVAWSGDRVILHDPARAPFRIVDSAAFIRAWSASGYWTLLALPGAATSTNDATDDVPFGRAAATPGVCGGMVDEAVRLARESSLGEAQRLLEAAVERCPNEAGPSRELAGVHVRNSAWGEAAAHARHALRRAPRDEHAARTLMTSLYAAGDHHGALDAWNLFGGPSVDLVEVVGLERTRYAVASRLLGIDPGAMLSSGRLIRARRRLDLLPSAARTSTAYSPVRQDLVRVQAAVLERPVLPRGWLPLTVKGARAAIDREVRVDIAGAMGGGELIYGGWRWWEARPRVMGGITAPSPFGGVWQLEAAAERETYGADIAAFEESRRRAALTITDWASARVGWSGGVSVERISGDVLAIVSGGLRLQSVDDRLRAAAQLSAWPGHDRGGSFNASLDVRSRPDHVGHVWIGRIGVARAGRRAPLAFWPGAGTGQGRDELLRAHPLLHDGAIRDGVFGRGLLHATGEWRRWSDRRIARVIRWTPAIFVDVARAFDAPVFADPRAHADVGIGVRLALPGANVVRVDVARGLGDGAAALSVGWAR
jgi:hypothetical protein